MTTTLADGTREVVEILLSFKFNDNNKEYYNSLKVSDNLYKKYLTANSVAVHLWNASWLDELNEYRKQSHGWRKYWNIIKAHIKKK